MQDTQTYSEFSKEEMEGYREEARKRWGHTEAYKQSEERVKKLGPDELQKIGLEMKALTKELAECMGSGEPASGARTQALIARHYEGLKNFYDPTPEIYRGLAEMYVSDPRFKANYEKVAKGLAEYMREAMLAYAKNL